MEWNKGQKRAITTIDKNVSVNAGAGSGKTRVLVDRYIYILEKGNLIKGKEIESIVAITFTKKASQEMKERIRESIRERFLQDKKWIRLYKDLEKANIGTIHSFCSRILRENPVESGVDPLFSIMDEYESDELLKETISECIVKGIEKDEDVYKLVKELNLDMLNRINETFMNIYKKIRSVGMSFDEISEITLNNIDNFKIEEKQINFIKKNLSYLMDKARKNSKLYKLKEDPIWINFLNNHVYDETILEDLNYIEAKIGNMKGEEERIEKIKNVINNVMKVKEIKYKDSYKALIKLLVIIDEKFTAKKKRIGCLD
ncbi:MAG TPA: UvrD-helicase domain-containing protein, partial [Tissierellales bacterium]|nr:UvrD-helicase domain-containing protein [Tissierellales bacterium]